jgi:four helix bundle protein
MIKYDLEQRLIKYSVAALELVESLPNSRGASHLASQLVRSGTAPSLMYGEATAAESRKDFIHKMKLALKELRESMNCAKIIYHKNYIRDKNALEQFIRENDELISIFVKSIQTAEENLKKQR